LKEAAFREILREGLAPWGLALTEDQEGLLIAYVEELILANQRMNLTAITDPEEVAVKHILDSLAAALAVELAEGMTLLDVGSGGGLPGIPLKIFQPGLILTLMEASRKKAEFLEAVCTRLFPEGWQVVWSRAEDAGRGPLRESFDLVTARAVAPLPVLAEFCLPLVRVGGRFLALKGPDGERELEDGARAIEVLGGRPEKTIRVVLPRDAGERLLIAIEKTGITPAKYPRRAGIPEKRPL
jgi:16S rRNA (guanine527-N7)-methyltransferase